MDRLPDGRSRVAWWGVVSLLGAVLVLFVAAFVGTFVFGLFVYYAIRPVHRRLHDRLGRRGVSASLSLLLVVVPILGLLGYAGLIAVRELAVLAGPDVATTLLERFPGEPDTLGIVLQSPGSVLADLESVDRLQRFVLTGFGALGSTANALLHLTLSLAFASFLLRDGPRLAAWFRDDVAGPDDVAGAYLAAVDADLGTVYFGNVLTVLLVGMTALLVYHGFNLVSPPPLRIPSPTLLALLTGLATFVPLVVGKLVYLPVAGYLALAATWADADVELVLWIVGFLVVAFLLLDLVPQTFVRPYLSGQSLHSGLVLFAYVLGAALFGWYGLFLGPLLAVLVVQAANIVLPELLHGERLTPETSLSIGADPAAGDEPPAQDEE